MKIAIIGGSGLLGSSLFSKLKPTHNEILLIGRSSDNHYQCNVSDKVSLFKILNNVKPDVIINLVAITDVDFCENKPNQAFLINVKSVENIVSWISSFKKECHLIHISTDQIYDGNGESAEEDIVLTNYYGFSKYTSELIASRVPSTILRTNFFGKSLHHKKDSFTDWIYKNTISYKKIYLFKDIFFSPLSMDTLCEIMNLIISIKPNGTFNLGSRNGLSKSDFGLYFVEQLKLDKSNIDVTSINDVSFMKTYRPKDMRLNVSKIEECLAFVLPDLKDEIDNIIGDYNEKT